MNKFCAALILLTGIMITAFSGHSQVNDAGLWISIAAEKKINSRFSVSLSEECRLNENISEVGTLFTDAGVRYKLNKSFSVSLNYRFIQKRKVDDFYDPRHRIYSDAVWRIKKNNFSFTLRERFQSQYRHATAEQKAVSPEYMLRSKLTLKYHPAKKYTPYVASEIFLPLNNPGGNELNEVRWMAGFNYEINKMHSLELFYLVSRELNVMKPVTGFIIGAGYVISL